MKKVSIAIVIVLALIFCCSGIIVLMATGIISKGDNSDYFIKENDITPHYDIKIPLESGMVDIAETLEGLVVAPENSNIVYEVEKVNEKFKALVSVGDYVKQGEPLYIDNNGNNVLATHNLSIVAQEVGEAFYLEVFAYNDLTISLTIDAKYQNSIGNIVFTTKAADGGVVTLELVKIDSVVTEDRVEVVLKCPFDLYNNTPLDVMVKYEEIEGLTVIPEEFVFKGKDGHVYIQVIDNIDNEGTAVPKDVYLDVYKYESGNYIVRDILDGYFAVYSQEEKFFEQQ